jgi:hypothetical protein
MSQQPKPARLAQSLIEHELAQPDELSCGAAALVMARALLDAGYAQQLAGSCPSVGGAGPCRVASDFSREVALIHRATVSLRGLRGLRGTPSTWSLPAQLPWARRLGTPPWALARALRGLGTPYLVRRATPARYGQITAALLGGHPVPLYVGTPTLPRHVTLIMNADADKLIVYNPARGKTTPLTREDYVAGALGAATGWPRPWWVLLPA